MSISSVSSPAGPQPAGGARGAQGAQGAREKRRAEAGLAVRRALVRGDSLTFAQVEALSDEALADLGFAVGAVRQDADRMMAVVAAETQKRSEKSGRGVGFARGHGHRNAPGMVEKQTGVSGPEARRLIELGKTLEGAERAARDGRHAGKAQSPAPDPAAGPQPSAPAEPVFTHVAAASRAGKLGAEAATAITRMLRRVASRADSETLVEAERDLVFAAGLMSVFKLGQLINRWEARLDADHLEELAAARRERRFLHVGESADGMIRVTGQLDPENGAPLVAVMGAMVNQHFRANKNARDAIKAGHTATVDERTPGQVCADAMGAFARHLAGCDVDVLPHASATIVVSMDYDTMLAAARGDSVLGASIDGLSSTPDAGELRRMMARAGLIPKVLGGGSCTLDVGYRTRSFSQPQRDALLARDGGCAKCNAPASWADFHHITPVEFGGKSDLSNAVTLCVKCHHDVHREGWIIVATATEVWFIPPVHLDPERTPHPGGRRLFDATAVYGDHLPPAQDVIARTPIAATHAGDHRRRRAKATDPPDRPDRSSPRPTGQAPAEANTTEHTTRGDTLACAMAPTLRSRVLVERSTAPDEGRRPGGNRRKREARELSGVAGAMRREISLARRRPLETYVDCRPSPRGRHPGIRVHPVPHGFRIGPTMLARGPDR